MDETDNRIVDALVRDGRASFAELGDAIGLSPHATAARVRRLQQAGVITGFTAIVDPEHLGRRLEALIDARLRPETPPEHFEEVAASLACVQEVAFLTGRADYQVRVSCRDADDLDAAVRALRQRGGVAATETRIIMRSVAHAVTRSR